MPTRKSKEVTTIAEDAGLKSVQEKVGEIHKIISQQTQTIEKKERKKRVLSEDQKNVLRERLVKARESRKSKKISE